MAYVGYEIGRTPSDAGPKMQILITALLTLPSSVVPVLLIIISDELEKEKNEYQTEIKQKVLASDQKKSYDFVSLLHPQIPPTRVNIALLEPPQTIEQFESNIDVNVKNFKKSLKAVNDLLTIIEYGGDKNVELLESIVTTALVDNGIRREDPQYTRKYNQLYGYLRAWLVCSLRYQTDNLPIEWIQENSLTLQELKQLINYVNNLIINEPFIKKIINDSASRQIISDYLKKLIEKIQEVSLSTK